MTPQQYIDIQDNKLKWTGRQMAAYLGKTEQSTCNYRHGRQPVIESVENMINAALEKAGFIKGSNGEYRPAERAGGGYTPALTSAAYQQSVGSAATA